MVVAAVPTLARRDRVARHRRDATRGSRRCGRVGAHSSIVGPAGGAVGRPGSGDQLAYLVVLVLCEGGAVIVTATTATGVGVGAVGVVGDDVGRHWSGICEARHARRDRLQERGGGLLSATASCAPPGAAVRGQRTCPRDTHAAWRRPGQRNSSGAAQQLA